MQSRKIICLLLSVIAFNSMLTTVEGQGGGIKKFYKYAALALLAGGIRGSGIGKGFSEKVVKMVTGQKDNGGESTKTSHKYAPAPPIHFGGHGQGLSNLGAFGGGGGYGPNLAAMSGGYGGYGGYGGMSGMGGGGYPANPYGAMSMGPGSMGAASAMGAYGGGGFGAGMAGMGGMSGYDGFGGAQAGMMGAGYGGGDLGGYGGIGHNLGGFNYGNAI